MSEIKRVALNTLEPQKVSDKVTKKQCKTIRISVILPESNEDNCPEYNYKDQLAAVKKKPKQVKDYNHVENGLDSFGETDDDVRRIALKMEAKYGTGMTDGKKKRKGRKDDYADIGMGYDESDSFIDNTDGYDEIIPQNVTTLHGGFYINCGALEFKTDEEASSQLSSSSSSFSDNEGGDQSKTNRKRILDTSSDSETATSQVEKKPKLLTPKDSMQQAIKKKLFSPNKIQVKKRRPIDPLKKTLKDLLREKREDLNMTIPSELKQIEENMEKDSSKENKVPMSITSVTDAIESVLKQVVEEDDYDKNQNMQSVDIKKAELSINKNVVESLKSQHVEAESSQELSKSEKQEVTKLPENLPPDIIVIVDKIRNAAVNYKGEGKKAFFTDEVNSYLLSLEKKCKVLGKSSRLRVYEHLSGFVVCRKETLIKRAKNLVFEDEEKRLKMLTAKLRDTINSVMPNLLSNYEQESQKVLQKKFSKENTNNEDMKALKMPRRKFQWTEDAKKLIKDILSIKKRCLLLEGKQKDKLEEQVVDYLRSSILPLWPEGWMYLNNLKKVYNSMTENSKLIGNKSTPSTNKSKHSNSTNNSIPLTETLNSTIERLRTDVQLFDSKYPSTTIQNANVVSGKVRESNSDQSHTKTYQGKSETKQPEENIMFKPYIDKNSKSGSQHTKSIPPDVDQPSDLSKNSTYDMFKAYVPDVGKQSEYSKSTGQSDVFKPYTDKILHVDKKETILSNADRTSPQAEQVPSQNISTYAENYVSHMEKYYPNKPISLDSSVENPVVHSENRGNPSRHTENNIEEIMITIPEKKIHKTENPKEKPIEKPNVVDKSQDKTQYMEEAPLENAIIVEKTQPIQEHRSVDKSKHTEKSQSFDKQRNTDNSQHIEKQRRLESHVEKSRHKEKYPGVDNISLHSEKYVAHIDKHTSSRERYQYSSEMVTPHSTSSHMDISPYTGQVSYVEKPSDLSKHLRKNSDLFTPMEKPKDFSKYEMFKPYAETPKPHTSDFPKHRSKEHYRPNDMNVHSEKPVELTSSRHKSHKDIPSSSSSKHDRVNDVRNESSSKHRLMMDLPKMLDDSGVIVKNTHQPKEDLRKLPKEDRKDNNAVITKVSHCQGIDLTDKKKLPKTPDIFTDVRSPEFFPQTPNMHLDYHSSTPAKSDGDDIQMVMENLKALQKLSCSPVKNDNSSSSPVSVIAYNKNFTSSKSISGQKTDPNNKGELAGGFQDEFQKQFINSLQQMAANPSNTKSGYNRCS